jgi:hypothetical protein
MTNATADTTQSTETVPPSQVVTRSTFLCDEVKRRSHSEKELSRFISCSGWFGCHIAPLTAHKSLGCAPEQNLDLDFPWKSSETTAIAFS